MSVVWVTPPKRPKSGTGWARHLLRVNGVEPHQTTPQVARQVARLLGRQFTGNTRKEAKRFLMALARAGQSQPAALAERVSAKAGAATPPIPHGVASRLRVTDWADRLPSEEAYRDFIASFQWRRLRMIALERLGRRCVCCGASPEDGVKIVVDHVLPVRWFWSKRLDLANLQVLCDPCNHGKGSAFVSDFRSDLQRSYMEDRINRRLRAQWTCAIAEMDGGDMPGREAFDFAAE